MGVMLAACSPEPSEPSLPDPEQVVAGVLALTGDPARGQAVFQGQCIFCHGDQAAGEPPTDFGLGKENPRRFRSYDELSVEDHIRVIVEGYVSKASGRQNMPAFLLRLSPEEIADVAAFERRIMAMEGDYWESSRRSWWPPDPKPLPWVP